jgi:hypothetical protein
MIERFYVFEREGPYRWQVASRSVDTYYDHSNYFNPCGYATEDEAVEAIRIYLSTDMGKYHGPFFIVKGYDA